MFVADGATRRAADRLGRRPGCTHSSGPIAESSDPVETGQGWGISFTVRCLAQGEVSVDFFVSLSFSARRVLSICCVLVTHW